MKHVLEHIATHSITTVVYCVCNRFELEATPDLLLIYCAYVNSIQTCCSSIVTLSMCLCHHNCIHFHVDKTNM